MKTLLCHVAIVLALAIASAGGDLRATPVSASISVPDVDGGEVFPFEAAGAKAFVFIFVRTDCPISNRYAPDVRRLYDDFARQQVAFRIVYPGAQDPGAVRRHLEEFGYPGTALRDPLLRLVDIAGATVTPEAAIFDASRTRIYHGRIDDRYIDIGRSRRVPTTRDVHDVLTALLAGRPSSPASQPAVGCFIADLR